LSYRQYRKRAVQRSWSGWRPVMISYPICQRRPIAHLGLLGASRQVGTNPFLFTAY
jgi:hypothetical protein